MQRSRYQRLSVSGSGGLEPILEDHLLLTDMGVISNRHCLDVEKHLHDLLTQMWVFPQNYLNVYNCKHDNNNFICVVLKHETYFSLIVNFLYSIVQFWALRFIVFHFLISLLLIFYIFTLMFFITLTPICE